MELRYPIFIVIITISIICYFTLSKKKQEDYTVGSKIANTEYLKNTEYYRQKIKEYNLIKKITYTLFICGIVASTILISRLAQVETVNNSEYNRDIFLCMDVSSSVDDLNLELVENLKNTVKELHGERFGISIFNTSSVVLVPLTDDYKYITDVLDKIKESIQVNNSLEFGSYDDKDYFYKRNYIYSGTLEDNETRGSSLIGDGLASCVYSFSNPNEERTRIIILSTDNDLAGTPLLSLQEAAQVSKSKNIKVFGIGTKIMKTEDRMNFKNAVEKTNGKFYEHSTMTVNNIVEDIESTSKSLLKNQIETKEVDIPTVPFIILIISTTGIILLNKKVIL